MEGTIDPSLLNGGGYSNAFGAGLGLGLNGHSAASAEEPAEQEDADMGDLFGDDDGDQEPQPTSRQSSATPSLPGSEDDRLTAEERQRRKEMEYEEAAEEEQVVELNEAHVQIPNVPLPSSSDGNYWILRTPNFIRIESHPFDPETYQGPGGDDEATRGFDAKEKSMTIKLEAENTIRWRWVKAADGTVRKQSNSRIVRWSDGTMSLQLGKELFDINAHVDVPVNAAVRSGQSQHQSELADSNLNKVQGTTYLYSQHVRAGLLQAEAAITGTMSLTPTGMQSETHRKLVKAVGQKHSKVTRLMMAPEPTKEQEQERADLLKASKKAAARRRRTAGEGTIRRRQGTGRASARRTQTDFSDEDQDDEEEEFSRSRYPRAPAVGRKRGTGEYEADEFVVEDDDDEGDTNGNDLLEDAEERIELMQQRSKKRSKDDDEDDEEADGEAMAMSDDDGAVVRPAGGRKTKRLALGDSDEE